MALYEMTPSAFRPIDETSFADIHVGERANPAADIAALAAELDRLVSGLYGLAVPETLLTGPRLQARGPAGPTSRRRAPCTRGSDDR